MTADCFLETPKNLGKAAHDVLEYSDDEWTVPQENKTGRKKFPKSVRPFIGVKMCGGSVRKDQLRAAVRLIRDREKHAGKIIRPAVGWLQTYREHLVILISSPSSDFPPV